MSALVVFKDAWANRDKLGESNKTRELAAFLPAALEVQEAPPNPLLRWLSRTLLLLIVIALTWSYFGHINIVASAEGKIIPSSRVKQIQPLEKGMVKTLFVKEGQLVEKGQPLIALDATLNQADTNSLVSEQQRTQLRLAVNQGFLTLLHGSTNTSSSQKLSDFNSAKQTLTQQIQKMSWQTPPSNTDLQLHQNLLLQQWLQYESQLRSLHSALAQNSAEQATVKEVITKLELILPVVNKRLRLLKKMFREKLVAETEYLQSLQEQIQIKQDFAAEKQRLKQLQEMVTDITQQINLHNAQSASAVLMEITEQNRQLAGLTEELIKVRDSRAKQVIYAPVAGRVQELMVNTIGGIVTEAQQLMLIVPIEQTLEAEVFLENKDIGFVFNGMSAEVKVHTFPFTKYGVIDAVISNVSTDATIDEKKGLIYRMQLKLAVNQIQVNNKMVNLVPGMSVTAEVQIGERRIIEFFLAPLLKGKQEALRER
ncbi:MAG: HlyD family secretion protein [Osedax symbiont Rs1]|nr:MAG: HlyD family secretion protein [Osedax symbiont Rs1]